MKISYVALCLVPSVALAVQVEQEPAVAPTANNLSSASSPELATPSNIEGTQSEQESHDQLDDPNSSSDYPDYPVVVVVSSKQRLPMPVLEDQLSEPAHGSIELRALEASSGSTKSLRARSEGTLGQTPWIGMAIGLTCTALAAVMLG
ncbi:hypothetical protein CNMCM5793_001117 [Aspergillus hiratsukae]|uniref:GPI anchored protein n=1 Tax=Aspergillus hiratsukae TaxID=1194566 RepID=A0A8H6UR72_9EURO|nr:hypothetical protein CNMCM5793_001117 [Aspergillus hiratsukae]KAF7163812.1 hypothetical protein CNMCM6106_000627 [Aspergillus hiratsukae]